MKFDTSQQISATYLRKNTSEIINQTIKEGMSVIVRRSKPTVIMLSMQEFEKLKNESKPKKHKKFNLEEIRKNSTFRKYRGCMADNPDFKGLTSVQIAKKWTDYVD